MTTPAIQIFPTPPKQYDPAYMQDVIGKLNRAFRTIASSVTASGNTVLNGSGAPTSSIGSNGDFYIDTAAEFIYGPKASGVWPAGISITGPAGEDGEDGAPGAAGAIGPPGPVASTSIRKVSANYLAITSDYTILVDASGGAVTVTMPPVPSTGQPVNVKKIDSTNNTVTVNGNGSNVEGNATMSTFMPGTNFEIQYDGTAWWLL